MHRPHTSTWGTRIAAYAPLVGLLLITVLTSAAWAGTDNSDFELHTDRPGSDYASFNVDGGAAACQQRCADDTTCKAWTFVGANAPGGSGRCWLKDVVPGARPKQNAVSGILLRLAVDHWTKPRADLTQLDWVDRIVRAGDVDNFGFGWPSQYNPFSGRSTPRHGYPFAPASDDPDGTDRIMLGSGYHYDGSPPSGTDGYTKSTSRPDNTPRTISIDLPADRPQAEQILLQMFIDDFQAPSIGSYFRVELDGERMPSMELALNAAQQTGPVGKLISLPLLPAYHRLLDDNRLEIRIDDPTTAAGDGYAIDFVRILINPDKFPYSASISGRVTRAGNGEPIAGALVSSALSEARTDADGRYQLTGIPAGLAVVRARKDGFEPAAEAIDLVADEQGRADLQLAVSDDAGTSLQRELEQKGRADIPGIYFDVASARLRDESTASLKQVLDLMQRHASARYRIEGHTDSQGEADYNEQLSRQRAQALVGWLVEHGIDAGRLVAEGFGETRPVANNATDAGRALNRRVEIALLQPDG